MIRFLMVFLLFSSCYFQSSNEIKSKEESFDFSEIPLVWDTLDLNSKIKVLNKKYDFRDSSFQCFVPAFAYIVKSYIRNKEDKLNNEYECFFINNTHVLTNQAYSIFTSYLLKYSDFDYSKANSFIQYLRDKERTKLHRFEMITYANNIDYGVVPIRLIVKDYNIPVSDAKTNLNLTKLTCHEKIETLIHFSEIYSKEKLRDITPISDLRSNLIKECCTPPPHPLLTGALLQSVPVK